MSQAPPAVHGLTALLRGLGHKPADGLAMECGDGTLWIVETEQA